MKIAKIFNSYVPQKKCGAEIAAADALTAALSGISIAGNLSASSNQMDAQARENQLNRDWQTAEAEKQRNWSTQMMQQQNAYNIQNMQEQARLNSPVYQSQQLNKAGLNPAVYFGQSSSFSGSSLPSSSIPSGANVGSVQGLSPVSYQPFGNVADIINAIGNFSAQTAKGQETRALLEEKLAGLTLDNESKDLINKMNRVELYVQRNIKDYRIKQELQKYEKACADTYLALASGDEKVSTSMLNYAQMSLTNMLTNKTGQEYEILKMELANWQTKFDALIDNLRGQTEQSRAGARNLNASAEQTEFFNQIRNNEGVRKSLTDELLQLGNIAKNNNKIGENQFKLLEKQCAQLQKATDNYEIQMWSDIINRSLGTVFNGIGEITRFGLAKKFLSSSSDGDNPPMPYWPGTTTNGQTW